MSTAASPLMKPLSTAAECCCFTSLPSSFTTPRLVPSLSVPFRPARLSHLSCFSSPSCPSWVSPKRKIFASNFVPLVAQTSDWARQDEEEESAEEKGEDGSNWAAQEQVREVAEGLDSAEEWGVVPESVAEGGGEGEGEGEEEGEGYPEPPEEAKLFVGNLPYDIDSEGLAKTFEAAGIVEIAEVIYNRDTNQSRGFGFVTMSTVEEAEKAVEMFHRYDLDGRLLTVNKAAPRGTPPERSPQASEPSYRIYVGNLPWQVDDARLEQVFSEHGKVVSARVVLERETRRSRGFGFVTMSNEAEMNDAISALDGQSLDGRTIRVGVAEERPRRSSFF